MRWATLHALHCLIRQKRRGEDEKLTIDRDGSPGQSAGDAHPSQSSHFSACLTDLVFVSPQRAPVDLEAAQSTKSTVVWPQP